MILVKTEDTPFTILAKVLVVVESVLVFIIEVVALDPPMLEVITFTDEDSVLGTLRLVTDRLVAVAEVIVAFDIVVVASVVVPVIITVPVAVKLLPVALIQVILAGLIVPDVSEAMVLLVTLPLASTESMSVSVAVIILLILTLPFTSKLAVGAAVLIPTLPDPDNVKLFVFRSMSVACISEPPRLNEVLPTILSPLVAVNATLPT